MEYRWMDGSNRIVQKKGNRINGEKNRNNKSITYKMGPNQMRYVPLNGMDIIRCVLCINETTLSFLQLK